MIFVETPVFTRQIKELVDDEAYSNLQQELARDPEAGVAIKGACGIRKIRIAAKGHGKSGGGRVIYYYFVSESRIAMLLAYPKNAQDDLSAAQLKVLVKIVDTWK
jgi:hypothetical protein